MDFSNNYKPEVYSTIIINRIPNITFAIIYIIIGLNVSISQPTFAQDNESEVSEQSIESEEIEDEIITVTGSRIKSRDFESASPLYTINKKDIEFSGQPTIEEYLNQLPQLVPDTGRTSNWNADGTAGLNLRGLGSGRTLVLLNGRRMAPSGVGGAIDVNNLPSALVEQVEVITGGASTVYGSDAIAGVINFITRKDYDGLSINSSHNITAKGDADIYDFNIAYGHDLENGNISVYAGFYERKPLFASERELTSVVYDEDEQTGELSITGSPWTPAGVIAWPTVDLGNGPVNLTWNPDGTPRARDPITDIYNYAPVNYLQTPSKRYSAGLMANFELSNNIKSYFELSFTRNQAKTNLAPSATVDFFAVNIDNPVLTPETRLIFEQQMIPLEPGLVGMYLGLRMSALGQRISDFERDYSRLVAGLEGEINDDWQFDAWISYTDASLENLFLNFLNASRVSQGLLVDPVTGNCYDPSDGCVPLDFFGAGRLSEAGADFLRDDPWVNKETRTQILASLVVTGSPFELFSEPLNMALGAEWRQDKGQYIADERNSFGSGVNGSESVVELFAEGHLAIINESSGHYLGIELGARWSEYENAGSVWTYKSGLVWQPLDSTRFRAMFQHAVRAPTIRELFLTQNTRETLGGGGSFTIDGCSASRDPVANGFVERCIAQGLPADQIGVFEAADSHPLTYISGGNPELQPESSDTFTIGFVFKPELISGLTIAVDYFDLEVTDTIGYVDVTFTCFDPLNTEAVFCDNIQRDITGNISELTELTSNRGLLSTDGVDTKIVYQTDLPSSFALFDDYTRLTLNSIWTYTLSSKNQENMATNILDCAGTFSGLCSSEIYGAGVPENRLTSSIDYISGPLNIHLNWRWIEGLRNGVPLYSADFGIPNPVLAIESIPSYSYFDLAMGYQLTDSLLARFGINNLADKKPPNMADKSSQNNTDAGLYDVFGRTYYASINMEF